MKKPFKLVIETLMYCDDQKDADDCAKIAKNLLEEDFVSDPERETVVIRECRPLET